MPENVRTTKRFLLDFDGRDIDLPRDKRYPPNPELLQTTRQAAARMLVSLCVRLADLWSAFGRKGH